MSSFLETFYAIIPTLELDTEKDNLVRASINTDIDSLLTSSDGSKTVVRINVCFADFFTSYEWYTKEELLAEIAGDPEWPVWEEV
jgi:hypothetical protein